MTPPATWSTRSTGSHRLAANRTPALRIGMLAPISWRVPPRHYGPWEQFVSLLTEGLVARGVDVTLFATADSVTSARLVAVTPTGYSEDPSLDAKVEEARHIAAAFERAEDFDLIHNSFDFLPLTYTRLVDTPVVTTIHGFGSDVTLPVYEDYADRVAYVAISDADRHPSLPYVATVHHGIDVDAFDLCTTPGDHLAFFGRIHPDKGTAVAIEVAAGRDAPGDRGHRPGPGVLRPLGGPPHRRGPRHLPRHPSGPSGVRRSSGEPGRCSTSSTSTSRSGSASSRRWPAAPRSSPTGAGRCPSW
jgi:hypothetical protein